MQTALPLSPRQLLIEVLMDLNEAEMHSRVLTSHKRHTYTPHTHNCILSIQAQCKRCVLHEYTNSKIFLQRVQKHIQCMPRKKIIHHSGDFSSALQKASRVQQVQAGV